MCKKQELYKLVYCCDSLEKSMKKSKNRAWDMCVKIKGDSIFIVCKECCCERIEALSYDYSKDQ